MTTATVKSISPDRRLVALGFLAGALAALALGVYGSIHDPTGRSLVSLFFTSTINLKVWLATIAVFLAVVQVVGALLIYGKLGSGTPPEWLGSAHRMSGMVAFLVSIPVAYHCLWALGFQSDNGTRVLLHSLFGCVFYGALVTKVFFVRSKGLPAWALPVAGGVLFASLVLVWLLSSFWYFTTVDFPAF